MNTTKRSEIFTRFAAAHPNPTTELHFDSPFQLLVAVILSAQATDKSVNRATLALFKVAPTPAKMLALGVAGLEAYIRTIGLYRSKARNLIETCRIVLREYGGDVPRDRENLEKLPGVGRKTANVILNTVFGMPTLAVDTHVFRVANRTGLAKADTVKDIEKKLLKYIPPQFLMNAHHWLILHGRYVCIARRPKCGECLINDLCEYPAKILP